MSQKFTPDYLSPAEAAEYMQCAESALKHLVAEGKLKAGVFSPGWAGSAFPAEKNDGLRRHWEGGISGSDDNGKIDHYVCRETGEEFTVRRGWVSQFWFIHRSDAYPIATGDARAREISFLEPVDCKALYQADPEHFPGENLIYMLDSEQEYSRSITWPQLLFRRSDLDSLTDIPAKSEPIKKAAQPRDTSLISTVAALMCCWPGGLNKIPSGKDLENAASASGFSISDDTARKVLKAAKDIIYTPK